MAYRGHGGPQEADRLRHLTTRARHPESASAWRYKWRMAIEQRSRKRSGGTPPRGERKTISVRFPIEDHEFIAQQADQLGIAEGTFVVYKLNEMFQREQPWWVERELERGRARLQQQELPMQQAS